MRETSVRPLLFDEQKNVLSLTLKRCCVFLFVVLAAINSSQHTLHYRKQRCHDNHSRTHQVRPRSG